MIESTNLTYLLATLVTILNIIDFASTKTILDFGGTELNPIVKLVFRIFGELPGLLIMKGLAIGVAWYFAFEVAPPYNSTGLLIMLGLYIIVVFNNIRVMNKNSINF